MPPSKRGCFAVVLLTAALAPMPVAAQVDVLTHGRDRDSARLRCQRRLEEPALGSSEESGNPNDSLGLFAKNNPPVVANGKVYVAAFQQETVDNNTGQHFKAAGGLQSALAIYGLK